VVEDGHHRTKSRLKYGFSSDAWSSTGENGCHRRQPFGNRKHQVIAGRQAHQASLDEA
jgi:hypothetical protein